MTISLYEATVPSFLQQLNSLDAQLAKAEQFCAEKGLGEDVIQSSQIVHDMLPFPHHVRYGYGHSIKAIEAIKAGNYSPDFSDPIATFAEQRALIASTIAALNALTADEVNALADKDVAFTIPQMDVHMDFTGRDFLLSFALPNFFFHVTTAYNLMRAKGVPIGKGDFLVGLRVKAPA